MSCSMIIYALLILLAFGGISAMFACILQMKVVAVIMQSIGMMLALAMFFLAFNFMNFAHLRIWMEYDHTTTLIWKPRYTETPGILDWDRVVYLDEYTVSEVNRVVIMAWDDPKPSTAYDEIVMEALGQKNGHRP